MVATLNEDLWTADEAAEQLGVSVNTIYAWVNRGALTPDPDAKRGRRNLFQPSAVFEAERSRKAKHRRKNPTLLT